MKALLLVLLLSDVATHEATVRTLTSALAAADAGGDAKAQVETAFQLARAYEEWAAADPARKEEHLNQAVEAYSRLYAAPGRPDAQAAARNNCAQILVTLGQPDRAADFFKAAIAIEGSMREAFYLANYAAFLAARGDRAGAIEHYERALALKPDDAATEAKLLQLSEPTRVTAHLWQLVDGNKLERAQRIALEHLGRNHSDGVKRELLSVVAATLARQRIRPEAYAGSATDARLTELLADPSIREGILELRRLYDGAALEPSSYRWWRQSSSRRPPAIDGPVAFSALARHLGEQVRDASDQRAERYFTLAIEVSDGADPEPFISLAELYYSGKRTRDLERIIDRYSDRMFSEKGAAYRAGDWRSIYRYHVALGTIFARLGWTGDERNPKSAIFQLEHARTAARELTKKTKTPVVLDPRSVDLLAQSYKAAQPLSGKDLKIRLDVAEEYVGAGHTKSAQRVLEPAAADPRLTQQGQDKLRYEQLQTKVPLKQVSPSAFKQSTVVKPVPQPEVEQPPVSRTVRQPAVVQPAVVQPARIAVTLSPSVKLDASLEKRLETLLAEYFATREDRRSDAKLKALGVVTIRNPVAGKGSVVMKDRVVVPFTTSIP